LERTTRPCRNFIWPVCEYGGVPRAPL